MDSVAVIAADIVARVSSGFPECQVPVSGMTAHTDLGLLLCRDSAFAKAYGKPVGRWIVRVIRADSVAACARLTLSGGGSGVSFGSVFGIHYTRLVLVAGQAGLRFALPTGWPILNDEQKDSE